MVTTKNGVVRDGNEALTQYYSEAWASSTISKSLVNEFLSDYLNAIKQHQSVYGSIIVSIRTSSSIPYSNADKNRILKFINSDNYAHSVNIRAIISNNQSDFSNYMGEFRGDNGKVIGEGEYMAKGIKNAVGEEVNITMTKTNIQLLDNEELMSIVTLNDFKKMWSLDTIMESLKAKYPYLIKGTGMTYKDFQSMVVFDNMHKK